MTVALAALGASVVPGTIHPVTFGGRPSYSLASGASVILWASRCRPAEDLAVSVYLPARTGRATSRDAQQVDWVSAAGDHAAEAGSGAFTAAIPSWYYVSGLRAVARAAGTAGGLRRLHHQWCAVHRGRQRPLAERRPGHGLAGPTLAVADEGIGGNRVLVGSLVLRCQRPGAVRAGRPGPARRPGHHRAGGDQRHRDRRGPAFGRWKLPGRIIAGYRDLIAQAHARRAEFRRDPAALSGARATTHRRARPSVRRLTPGSAPAAPSTASSTSTR